jgi:DNA replication licensing factor MCM3
MVSLEGIVTKCSLVRPKIVKSVHWNERKGVFLFRKYQDQTMTANSSTSTGVYPQEDDDGNPVGLISSMRTCMLMGASSL